MAITKALEFDQTANKLLFQVGEEAKQQRLQEEKLKAENNDRMLRVMSGLNPDVLSTRYRKEVVDAGLKDLMNSVSSFNRSNPNASPIETQEFINKAVSEMGQWSARVDANSKAIDESIEMLGGIGKKGSIYLPTLKAAAENEALYKTDALGRKVLRPYNEMPVVTTEFVQKLVNENPENFIDAAQIDRMFTDELGDESLFKKSETIIETTPDGRKIQKEVFASATPYYMEEKDGTVDIKRDNNGYISEDVYEKTISSPAREVWVRSMAKSNMNKAGVPPSPEAEEWFKRAALTQWFENKKRGFVSKLESVGYKPAPRSSAAGGSGAAKEPPPTVDLYSEIVNAVDKGKQVRQTQGGKVVQTFGFPLSDITQSAKDIILANVNRAAQFKGSEEDTPRDYTQDDVTLKRKDKNTIGVYEYPSGKFLTDVAKMDVNVKGSGAVGGQKSKVEAAKKAVGESYIIGGKTYTKSDLTKLGYTEEQIKQAISLGNIKTK